MAKKIQFWVGISVVKKSHVWVGEVVGGGVISVVQRRHPWVVISVVKKRQFWVLISVVKKRKFWVIIRVVNKK